VGTAGCVSYLFQQKGYIAIAADKTTEDKLMEIALEAGAEDIQSSPEGFEIYTTPHAHEAVLKAVKDAGIDPDDFEIGKYAENLIVLDGGKASQMVKLIDAMEDSDDVNNVWTNFDASSADES
jgi:transcriptional/translational regulatory protein YebC/TACO1